MSLSKRHLLAAGTSVAIVLAPPTHAQAPVPNDQKSSEIGTLADGEAYMIGKDMQLHKSNVKVTAAQHRAAWEKGAQEVRSGVVIYRWNDRFYMMDDIGRNARVNYEDQFILDP